MSLRIIGGEYRRRKLATPPTRATRPYTDRVRQMVFDKIDHLVENARVADIFAGVGTMGLEALSRGAQSCVFIEGDVKVHQSLRDNVQTIAAEKNTVCWKTNIHRTSFRPNGSEACLPYSLVFLDLPYAQCPLLAPREVLGKGLVRLAKSNVTDDDALVILRTPAQFDFSETAAWKIDDLWRISSMKLWLLKKQSGMAPQASEQNTAQSTDDEKRTTAEDEIE